MVAGWTAVALTVVVVAGGRAGDDQGHREAVSMRAVAPEDTSVTPNPVLDGLADGAVLDVTVTDGVAGAGGVVRQCVRTTDGVAGCLNDFPVQFGEGGDARFLYELIDTGRCGATASCVLVVDDVGVTRRAVAHIVFGAPAPPAPDVAIATQRLVEAGDEVVVTIGGLTPGVNVQVGYCGPDCGRFTDVVADADGRATTTVVVGTDCERCGIAVIGGPHDSLVPVPFAPPPQPRYDGRRLATGLLVAAALLLAAWRIVIGVDWSPPSEAATPDMDAVEL